MSIITNLKNLAKNDLRKKTLQIAEAGYEAIEIEKIIKNRIKIKNGVLEIIEYVGASGSAKNSLKINLNDFKRIFIVGVGKGSALAVSNLAEILGEKLVRGIALDIFIVKGQKSNVRCFKGTHPFPSEQNIIATQEIIKLAKSLNKDDLLITFICGGGSALACASESELNESISAIKELTKSGAAISELNAVRKHLSGARFKGGGLTMEAYPAKVVSLIVSDVCGNDLSMVASGPTVFDKTTKIDAENILKKYGIDAGKFHLSETPKEQKYFKKVDNILFVCNQDAVMAMMNKAEELGFKSKIHSLALEGEASAALSSMIAKIKTNEVLIAAGETTVNLNHESPKQNKFATGQAGIMNYELGKPFGAVQGKPFGAVQGKPFGAVQGKGGRNQEAVLGALVKCQMLNALYQDSVFISFTSDARDNTEAAGAIGDSLTLEKAKKLKLKPEEFLKNHDSFNFFKKTGDLIYAEQKCFNVADLMVILKISNNELIKGRFKNYKIIMSNKKKPKSKSKPKLKKKNKK